MFRIFIFTLGNNIKNFWIALSIVATTIVMIAILGSALESMQASGVYSRERVMIHNQLDEPFASELDDLMAQEEFDSLLDITYADSIDGYERMIENGQYETVISCTSNQIKVITVYSESFVIPICSNFVQTNNAISMMAERGALTNEAVQQYSQDNLITKKLVGGSPVGVDYYGVMTFLQMITLLATLIVFATLDDRTKNIYPRLMTAPISRNKIIAARMLASILTITITEIITAVVSSIVLGVDWSGNYLVILVVFVLFALVATLLGMIAATLTRSLIASIGIVFGVGSTLWSKYAGAISPYTEVSLLSYMTPTLHARNALFATIYDSSTRSIVYGILGLIAIATVMFAMYALIERKMRNDSI